MENGFLRMFIFHRFLAFTDGIMTIFVWPNHWATTICSSLSTLFNQLKLIFNLILFISLELGRKIMPDAMKVQLLRWIKIHMCKYSIWKIRSLTPRMKLISHRTNSKRIRPFANIYLEPFQVNIQSAVITLILTQNMLLNFIVFYIELGVLGAYAEKTINSKLIKRLNAWC